MKTVKNNFAVLILYFAMNSAFAADCSENSRGVTQLLAGGAVISSQVQTDYGRMNKSAGCYLEAWPDSIDALAKLVKIAYQNDIPIRTQGAAHSKNGTSLPRQSELLIQTGKLNEITFAQPSIIRVGAGIPIDTIKQLLSHLSSFFLPVVNSGGEGPTVGGYISAGGVSAGSGSYGGFWEHVYAITLVSGNGKVLKVKKEDPLFAYLFGSMGQLGIIAQVDLKILRDETKELRYPLGLAIRINDIKENGTFWTKPDVGKAIYWFNLFVTQDREAEAKQDLLKLQNQYADVLDYIPLFRWQITYLTFMPPLVFNQQKSFAILGIWGTLKDAAKNQEALKSLAHDFFSLVLRKNYRCYIQEELYAQPELFEQYFDAKTYNEFKQLKKQMDPEFLFNQHDFFA